jgi:hypothetical protein
MSDTEVDELGPVDYVVVEFPADKADFSGEMAAQLSALVERDTIRVLDLIMLKKELDGSVEGFESHDFGDGDLSALRELETDLAMLLARTSRRSERRWNRAASRQCWSGRTCGPRRSAPPCAGRADNWWPAAGSRSRPSRPRSRRMTQ